MNTRRGIHGRSFLFAGAVILGLAGAFFLGSRLPRTGGEAEERKSGRTEEAGHKEAGGHEDGVIEFDPASLKRAGIQVEPVTHRPVQAQLAVTGTIEPNLAGVVKITPRVAGKVTSVRVNMGDTVKAGETLGTLASTELGQAQAAHSQALARVRVMTMNLKRQRELAGLGEFGQHKVEEARSAEAAAAGEVNRLRSELAASRNAITEARSDLAARQGEVAGEEAEVVSGASEIADAESEVRALQAALAQAQTNLQLMGTRLSRAERLHAAGVSSLQQVEEARAARKDAEAQADAARAKIAQGEARVLTARAHVQAAREKVRAAEARAEEAKAKIETAGSRQAQVEASLAAAEKRAAIALQSQTREERVLKGGFLATKEIVDAEAALRQAELERDAAVNNIRLLGGRPGAGDVLTITAPLGGRVTERLVTLGQTVSPSDALFTIVNLASVWVQLNVYQRDLPSIRVGQAITVTSDTAPGRTFRGSVSYIGDLVDETTRTVKVRCIIENAANALKPQTFVRGTIASEARASALLVPRDAVQTYEGKTVVFVQADHPGEFETRGVQTGETVGDRTVIATGLKPGDRVVTRGAFMVKAQGMKSELGHEH